MDAKPNSFSNQLMFIYSYIVSVSFCFNLYLYLFHSFLSTSLLVTGEAASAERREKGRPHGLGPRGGNRFFGKHRFVYCDGDRFTGPEAPVWWFIHWNLAIFVPQDR